MLIWKNYILRKKITKKIKNIKHKFKVYVVPYLIKRKNERRECISKLRHERFSPILKKKKRKDGKKQFFKKMEKRQTYKFKVYLVPYSH